MASGPRLTLFLWEPGQAQAAWGSGPESQPEGRRTSCRQERLEPGGGGALGGGPCHPLPPMGCGGEQRRLCSLPAWCHHMVYHITVTAWNGDLTSHQEPGLWGLGTVRSAPPSGTGPTEASLCIYCAWSSVQPWHLGALTPALSMVTPDATTVPTLVPGHVTCRRTHSALSTMPGGHGVSHLASHTQVQTQQIPLTDTHARAKLCANTALSPGSNPLRGRIPGGGLCPFLAPGGRPGGREAHC